MGTQRHLHTMQQQQAPVKKQDMSSVRDKFDSISPRDISLARYIRNHEWMEEILGSAIPTKNIVPPQLNITDLSKEELVEKIRQSELDLNNVRSPEIFDEQYEILREACTLLGENKSTEALDLLRNKYYKTFKITQGF